MILTIIIIVLAILLFFSSFYTIRPIEKGIIERLGKFHSLRDSGWHFKIPIIDHLIQIPIVEETIDVPKQPVITKDNVSILVDGLVYLKVQDVKKAIYTIDRYKTALTSLAKTTLRSIIGTMELDEVLNNREAINNKMVNALDKVTQGWGVDITRMEIQELLPPKDILNAMERQVVAERKKRETIINSEAKRTEALNLKEAEITTAEGSRQSDILTAEGEAKAIELKGTAEAMAIKKINEQMKQHGEKYVQLKHIEQWNGEFPNFMMNGSSNTPFLLNMPEDVISDVKPKSKPNKS